MSRASTADTVVIIVCLVACLFIFGTGYRLGIEDCKPRVVIISDSTLTETINAQRDTIEMLRRR
jgi:hypothetical protein